MEFDHHKKWSSQEESIPQVKMYIYSIPQLALGILGLAWCWLILTRLPPAAIVNIGGEKVYAPLLLGASWTSFWLAAYFCQSWRRGLWISLAVSAWFWLRLHQQSLFPSLFLFAGVLIIIELYLTRRRT